MSEDSVSRTFMDEVEDIRRRKSPYQNYYRDLQLRTFTCMFGGGLLLAAGVSVALSLLDIADPAVLRLISLIPPLGWAAILVTLGGALAFYGFSMFLDLEEIAQEEQMQYLTKVLVAAQRNGMDVPDWILWLTSAPR